MLPRFAFAALRICRASQMPRGMESFGRIEPVPARRRGRAGPTPDPGQRHPRTRAFVRLCRHRQVLTRYQFGLRVFWLVLGTKCGDWRGVAHDFDEVNR